MNFGGTILLLFTRDANVINICIAMMRVVSPAYITYICIEILSGTCRGCGDSFFPMLLTCFGVCVLRILWITIARSPQARGRNSGIFLSTDLDHYIDLVYPLL